MRASGNLIWRLGGGKSLTIRILGSWERLICVGEQAGSSVNRFNVNASPDQLLSAMST